jgi:hypothetical protein
MPVFIHDAIMYMTSEEDLRLALQTAARHCKPAGVLLVMPDMDQGDLCFADDARRSMTAIPATHARFATSNGHLIPILPIPRTRSTSRICSAKAARRCVWFMTHMFSVSSLARRGLSRFEPPGLSLGPYPIRGAGKCSSAICSKIAS